MALTATAAAWTGGGNTSPVTPAYPAPSGGVLSSDLLVLLARIHKSTAAGTESVATPAGWSSLGSLEGGTATQGADIGRCVIAAFAVQAAGGETGTLSVTINNIVGGASGTNAAAQIIHVRGATGAYSTAAATGTDDTGGAALSVTFGSDPGIASGDLLVVGFSSPTDTVPGSGLPGTVAATGATIGAGANVQTAGGITGLDGAGYSFTAAVTAGTGTAAPTWTATLGATNTNWAGPAALVRIREAAAAGGGWPPPMLSQYGGTI